MVAFGFVVLLLASAMLKTYQSHCDGDKQKVHNVNVEKECKICGSAAVVKKVIGYIAFGLRCSAKGWAKHR